MHALLRSLIGAGLLTAALSPAVPAAHAADGAFLPVGDPLEAELRTLEVLGAAPEGVRHASTRPWTRRELARALAADSLAARGPGAIARARLARDLARDGDAAARKRTPGATPRAGQWVDDDSRLELSVGAGGAVALRRDEGLWSKPAWRDGSGLRLRLTAGVGPWVAHTDLAAGALADVRSFSDPLIEGRDVALSTEDSYVALAPSDAWDLRVGRTRWHWGPGEEGSLLLSGSAPAMSGLALRGHVAAIGADVAVLHATPELGRGEQLAAHRLEWQPRADLRVGVAEAARYRASGWPAAYLASVIPFSLVQRLLDQDAGQAADSLRNNVLVSIDAAWRIAPGTRVYGELLIDDVHARSSAFPDKWGYQLGLDGVGPWLGGRLTWNAEYTRLSRFVYTSYYGRSHTVRGAPLGAAIGPDAKRLRLRLSFDPSAAWQFSAFAAQTDRGESDLATPFVPGDPVPDPMTFAGVVETTRTLEAEARWWPASGVDAALRIGREHADDTSALLGASRSAWIVHAALTLWR